mgnify:CR=1 FL=1
MKIISFIRNNTIKIILLCTIIITMVVLYQNTEVFLSFIPFSFYLLFGILLIYGILIFYAKHNLPDMVYILVIILVSFLLRLFFIIIVNTPISSDFLLIYDAAKKVIVGDTSWQEQSFFSTWSYQIPFVYYEALLLKLFRTELILKIFNIAFMVSTNVLIYLIAKEYTNSRIAFISAFLYSIYPAPILLTSVLTNQHISLFFFITGIYFYLIRPTWLRMILAGTFFALGNLMRPEGILVIGSVILHHLIMIQYNIKWKNLKQHLCKLLLLLLIYGLIMQTSTVLFKITGAAPHGIANNCPEWKFIVGLDTDSMGTYNEKNASIILISDLQTRKEQAKDIIVKSLKSSKNIPLFFIEKFKIMWGRVEATTWSLSHIQNDKIIFQLGDITYRHIIDLVLYFDKGIVIIQLMALIFSCISMWKEQGRNNMFFFIILIILNYFTYTLIEIQPRYRYFIMPSFFILSAIPIEVFIKKLNSLAKNRDDS